MTNARELARLGNTDVITADSNFNVGIGSLTPDAKLDVAGIVSATSFYGSGANLSGIVAGADLSAGSGAQRVVVTSLTSGTMTAAATDADLSWNSTTNTLSAPTLSGNITGTAATFSGDVSIAGTITYEDVTNIDSVGVITSRDGIRVGASQSISPVSGTLTYYGDGSNLDGIESGVVNFVASGTIDNGATVIIKDDGTVGIVTTTTSDTPTLGTGVTFLGDGWGTVAPYFFASTYDTTNDKIVIAYQDNDDSNKGKAIVGTVSGDTISFGTPATFGGSTEYTKIVYDSANEKVVIAYIDNDNSYYGTAVVGTVSGDTIGFGTEVVFNSATTDDPTITYDSINEKVVIAYKDDGNSYYGTARVGTVDTINNTIGFGNSVVFNSASTSIPAATFDPDNGKVVIVYIDTNPPYYGTAIVGEVIGTGITFGTPVVFESAATNDPTITYDSINEKVVIAYQDQGNSSYGTAIVGEVIGTGITFGTPVVFDSTNSQEISSTYDSTNDKIVIAYKDDTNSGYGTVVVGTVNGDTISFGSTVVFYVGTHSSYNSATYDPDNDKVAIFNQGTYNNGYAVVFSPTTQVTNLTSENYIGIAGEAISNAATGKVNVVGGVNSGQSGLTTNRKYYVGQTGILTTTADTPSVVAGTSISDTKILVWKS